uniref:Importin N-terminal domain-containing protein n=1 Tax=Physcomitrium patens TaxID=3218 RepID=A0A2K1IAZ9_PHYPA|nr:hypothetical protein PHYPA_031014 [Physcomitrium patens]
MEAMVELPSVVQVQIAHWLSETASTQEASVRNATTHLQAAQNSPKFALYLLMLSAGAPEKGQRIAAATYLKNFLISHWSEENSMSVTEKLEFRNRLMGTLLRVDGLVLKLLSEAFRVVAVNDFAKNMTWPELVPAFKAAIQSSNLLNTAGDAELRTLNVLIGVQTITKPFQYFLNPTVAHEPVPEQLELIANELLSPLHGIFHHLVQQVVASKEKGYAQHDNILHVLCKAMHLALKSHMPSALLATLGQWFYDFMLLLEVVALERTMDLPEQLSRLKTWKRVLQICCNLISRHRKHVDKLLPAMSNAALKIVGRSASAKDLHLMQHRIVSLAFDLVANILETGPGWRLMAPHFSNLLETAIFPALIMTEKDLIEWGEDEDEYLRKNLPSDMDEASGWKEDLLTPRQSALNLLSLIATAKGPPTAGGTKKGAAMKRKKGGKGKGKDWSGTAGEILVMPFLSQFHMPADGSDPRSEDVMKYYAVMMAYGSLQQYLKKQPTEKVALLLQTRVLPLYSMVAPTPYVLANANWLLGELANFLPDVRCSPLMAMSLHWLSLIGEFQEDSIVEYQELCEEVYNALLKALLAPNAGGVSWRPVRASAAGALSSLLQDGYKPSQWLPLLQATVTGARMPEESEASLSLQLLATAADAGDDCVAPHVPAITAAVQVEIVKHIPPYPEPWPQVVELGFTAVASLAQTWDGAEPDEDEDGGKALTSWKMGCETVAFTLAELLQRAWLTPVQDGCSPQSTPPSSCLSDASVLLAAILRYTRDSTSAATMKIEALLHVWANLVADWNAWEEEEDESVFDSIEEAVALQGRCPMLHFTMAEALPTSAHQEPKRSVLECLVTFITSAIESAYPAACWRACRCAHALLHATQLSFEGEAISNQLIPRLCEIATRRLKQLTSVIVPLAKPLILVITMCFIVSPEQVEKILSSEDDTSLENGASQGLLMYAESLASLAESEADPGLSLESEMKLAVIGLLRVIEHFISKELLKNQKGQQAANHCLRSLLESMVDLKELVESPDTSSDTSDTSESGSGSESGGDGSIDGSSCGVSNDEREENVEEYLERYAATARELQDEANEEAENGQDEDGHEIELGVLALVDYEKEVLACLKQHSKTLCCAQTIPKDLLTRFSEKHPEAMAYL